MNKTKAFFRREGDHFVGNDAARGPWSERACHAGPVTGVIAGALEQLLPHKQLARITVRYMRPVPLAGFSVSVSTIFERRVASYTSAKLVDVDGKVCAEAEGLHLVPESIGDTPTADASAPLFSESTLGRFPVQDALHDKPFFGSEIEIAYPPDQDTDPGPTTLWMRAPAIVEGETPSPFQTLCPLADCANGISRNSEFLHVSCVNPDLTIVVHRLPESDWLASRAISFWEPNGVGSTNAILFDERGAIGSALQTLVLRHVD
ncbi:MAG: thioesterase family protein [Woeseiaceae bacterium]|nr:thioesterase family protein [Woeseiaceae bacterium]